MISRLFLVTANYYPDGVGGAERQARILAEALGRQGVDVTLVAPSIDPAAPAVEPTGFGRIERFHHRAYPSAGGRHIAAFLRWTWWFQQRFAGRITPRTPVYVFHARLHALAPALAARRAGAPLAIKLGGGGEASDFCALQAKRFVYGRWVQSYLLRKVDTFVANGSQIEADLAALGVPPGRIAAFPNGVVLPPDHVVAAAAEARTGDRFLFAGRLVEDKRLHVLYEATLSFAGTDARGLPHLTLLGDGAEGRRLKALPRTAQEAALVAFPGFAEDVYPALWQSDFFVSASQREGQSNALLEAMSAGLIPIIFGASGATDVVDHGRTGFIVDASEPGAFADAMALALALPAERRLAMSAAARAFAAQHIGIDAIARRTLEMFAADRLPRIDNASRARPRPLDGAVSHA